MPRIKQQNTATGAIPNEIMTSFGALQPQLAQHELLERMLLVKLPTSALLVLKKACRILSLSTSTPMGTAVGASG